MTPNLTPWTTNFQVLLLQSRYTKTPCRNTGSPRTIISLFPAIMTWVATSLSGWETRFSSMTMIEKIPMTSRMRFRVRSPSSLEESRTAIKDDGLGDFFEVGTSLANERPHDEPAVDLDEETKDDEYQSVIEHGPQSTECDPPIIETEHEEGATTSITPDAEETLRMITSGAAIEAAMNAFPWHFPPVEFLAKPPKGGVASAEIRATSDLIEETLAEHSVSVSVDQVRVGPTVTMYGLKPGWKSSGAKSNSPAQRVRVDIYSESREGHRTSAFFAQYPVRICGSGVLVCRHRGPQCQSHASKPPHGHGLSAMDGLCRRCRVACSAGNG